jgi:hypothetical protein
MSPARARPHVAAAPPPWDTIPRPSLEVCVWARHVSAPHAPPGHRLDWWARAPGGVRAVAALSLPTVHACWCFCHTPRLNTSVAFPDSWLSHGRFLGWAWKPRSSRDYVGVESWVAIGGGYTEFAGFAVVHQKTTRFLGWSTKPRQKNRRRNCNSIGPIWPVGLTDLTIGYRSDRWGAPVRSVCDDAVRRLRRGGQASGSYGLRRG